ncbi:unnamed protein product [Acanthoscelides obtectus]|uniref:Saposin B-type domain-containing protein n=1 Tax=Acanthoscelides obtectus TaxID=200917 RepID=A0A9P0LUY5_ACAOB|nr:unnamed protein product [Acanthoscelides obtectus]CAK1640188.1 hypothetical protein AOBTE_LOCUS11588 [Acanthoscelides obtectus]
MKSVIGLFILIWVGFLELDAQLDSGDDEAFFVGELTQLFRQPSYNKIEPKVIQKLIFDLQIGDELKKLVQPNQHQTLCHVCLAAVNHLMSKKLTVQLLFEKLCNIYLVFATWTISGFCEELFNVNAVSIFYIQK